MRYGDGKSDQRKRPAADRQPTRAELDEPVTIPATPDELATAVMTYRPPQAAERSDD